MSNKCLPRDVEETKMMKNNDLDKRIMINTSHLLRVWLLLQKMSHLLNVPGQEIRKVQHPHPGKMHEKPDVIGVQLGESALTSEIFLDDFYHGEILVFKKSERKESLHLISILGFDIRFIIVFI